MDDVIKYSDSEDESKRKGPGRPKKKPNKKQTDKIGIANQPKNINNHVEFIYDNPEVFKKLFQFFKSAEVDDIEMIFNPASIIMYTTDHSKKTQIRVKIDAAKLSFYYCKEKISIGIKANEIEPIMKKIDKWYDKLTITVSKLHSELSLTLQNTLMMDECFRIERMTNYNKIESEQIFNDLNYMIKFTLPSKFFKKFVSDIKELSNYISIVQEGENKPVKFEYEKKGKKVKASSSFKEPEKVNLVSTITNEGTFRVSLVTDHIKDISSSQLSEQVDIMIDENKYFSTFWIMDGGIEIRTLTELVTF